MPSENQNGIRDFQHRLARRGQRAVQVAVGFVQFFRRPAGGFQNVFHFGLGLAIRAVGDHLQGASGAEWRNENVFARLAGGDLAEQIEAEGIVGAGQRRQILRRSRRCKAGDDRGKESALKCRRI